MNTFFSDFMHLTEFQMLVKYWWLWLLYACFILWILKPFAKTVMLIYKNARKRGLKD